MAMFFFYDIEESKYIQKIVKEKCGGSYYRLIKERVIPTLLQMAGTMTVGGWATLSFDKSAARHLFDSRCNIVLSQLQHEKSYEEIKKNFYPSKSKVQSTNLNSLPSQTPTKAPSSVSSRFLEASKQTIKTADFSIGVEKNVNKLETVKGIISCPKEGAFINQYYLDRKGNAISGCNKTQKNCITSVSYKSDTSRADFYSLRMAYDVQNSGFPIDKIINGVNFDTADIYNGKLSCKQIIPNDIRAAILYGNTDDPEEYARNTNAIILKYMAEQSDADDIIQKFLDIYNNPFAK
jgi:hypothetical protein